MEVNGLRPDGASTYAPEVGWEEHAPHIALRARAREVVAAARETVAHSRELEWRLGEWKKETFV